ncbi:conserved hypothetical protein, PP_1857 family [Noviherbaspirillum humi]|uniref:Protein-arginine rhamnosyltransferase n=1 Tax=Noviherbaspirillum humi TaxID=1688639 RepID=A0A239GUL3_9BURK|nr:elongation factor P maturation arginine rhamnosyltransferase EarP [Noviherbaspirillum humi]SNS71754.1 conserved hypothetical protein, PP_1857 family [Noviherbaspirillum humi]
MHDPLTLHLFCRVIDNYGDIGICWRFARQLHQEHGIAVTLWVDDLRSFHRICPEVSVAMDTQVVAGIGVRYWRTQDGAFSTDDIADMVIEFFGCDLPPGYIAAMAQCAPPPVWLNLEGLTAEEWVEGCHTLPSPHPRLPLTKYFFFPGFTAKTGGLLREASLEDDRLRFQSDPARVNAFFARLGVTPTELAALKVSLFCYPHAPVASLFDAWQHGESPVTCFVPEGVAPDAVHAFFGRVAMSGDLCRQGALSVRILPFVPQQDYDKLLWACDLNFVRGEDSFVRAQWAEKPFVWHIYPQDEDLHHKKLRAFLDRYATDNDGLRSFSLHWNGAPPEQPLAVANTLTQWRALQANLPSLAKRAGQWKSLMMSLGDFTSNLLEFVHARRSAPAEK